jgi:NADH dehydrogenase
MTLIEIGDRILPALDRELSQFALDRMRERKIDVRLNTGVTEVQAERVKLSTNEWIDTHTVIWCAGIAAPPLLGDLTLPLDNRGYLVCDRDLRVSGQDNVWAIGDCAVNTDASGRPYPATAQHAVRQGAHLARNLARVLSGNSTLPCDITSSGAVAALGCRTGVAKIFGIKLAGFPAWFLWRSIYLLKMPGFSRKLRIALDWAMDLVFKREYIQFGVHNHHRKHRSDAKSP